MSMTRNTPSLGAGQPARTSSHICCGNRSHGAWMVSTHHSAISSSIPHGKHRSSLSSNCSGQPSIEWLLLIPNFTTYSASLRVNVGHGGSQTVTAIRSIQAHATAGPYQGSQLAKIERRSAGGTCIQTVASGMKSNMAPMDVIEPEQAVGQQPDVGGPVPPPPSPAIWGPVPP